jgi:hypothetical protein
MCWTCGCGELENRHDSRALVTADFEGAAEQAGCSLPEVVANIVLSLAHYNPALAKSYEPPVRGTILKSSDEDRFLLTVAYSPNRIPLKGADGYLDVATPEVLEKACWRFAMNGYRTGMWHTDGYDGVAQVVENYIYRNPSPWVVKDANETTTTIREGDWLVGLILNEEAWVLYKAGMIGGVSMQGDAKRVRASSDTLKRMEVMPDG